MPEFVINRVAFRAWLEAFNKTAFVGESGNPCSCPIARFLESIYGKAFTVGPALFGEVGLTKERYHMPDWARAFVYGTDRRGVDVQIDALLALRILSSTSA